MRLERMWKEENDRKNIISAVDEHQPGMLVS